LLTHSYFSHFGAAENWRKYEWLSKLDTIPSSKETQPVIQTWLRSALHRETDPVGIEAYLQYLYTNIREDIISLALDAGRFLVERRLIAQHVLRMKEIFSLFLKIFTKSFTAAVRKKFPQVFSFSSLLQPLPSV
jgi:hypothetical protein